MRMRKTVTAVVVAGSMLGGAATGIALYAPGAATAQSGQPSSVVAASAVPAAAAATAPQWMTDELKKLVDAGTINQSQSDAIAAALAAAQPPRGPGGPGGPGFGHGPHELGDDLDIAAKAIGISTADLQTALQSGQSLAAVAKAHNVDPQKVIDALVADEQAELADQVKNGTLTQAQADQMKNDITPRVTDRVNGVGGPHGGPGHGRGPGAPAPAPGTDNGAGGTTTTTVG